VTLANPTRSYNQRLFSTSSRSLANDDAPYVPRTPQADNIGAHASQVPDFKKYTSKATETGTKGYSYFAIGTMGLITAAGAKSLVSDFLKNMSASADVLALAKVEVAMNEIPEGKNVIIKVSEERTMGRTQEINAVTDTGILL
jgi:ubiquinol-cytochrome c reductase iron-sulfur subunit